MSKTDDADREIKVMLLAYSGKILTPEVKKEILDKTTEILDFHDLTYLQPYFEENKMKYKSVTNSKTFSGWIYTSRYRWFFLLLFTICLFGMIWFSKLRTIILVQLATIAVLGFLLNWIAKRDVKKIEAEKYGMTVKEYDEFNKTGKL